MISILLSSYNSNQEYIQTQIHSIMMQTETNWELLIYNDGTPDLKKWVEPLLVLKKVRYFDEGHKGYAMAYDYLLKKAKGEYVCFCDHDDIWEPDKLEIEKEYLDKHPDVDCVFCWLKWFGEKEKIESFSISDEDISKELCFWQPIKNPTVMFRKKKFGSFDAPFDTSSDFWFWAKNKDKHYHLIEKVLVNYRRHSGEATKDKTSFRKTSAIVIQENMRKKTGIAPAFEICEMLDRYSKKYNPELKRFVAAAINGITMPIVFCIDENYIKYATKSISTYKQKNPNAKIIVVSERPIFGIGEDENVLLKLPRKFRNRGDGDRITNTAYLKCFLTELEYDKILYVDADTICQRPLDELWKIPCKYINLCESHKYGKEQAKAIGHKKYGLTGMMVMNLKNLRKIRFTEKCLDVEKNYPTPETGWQHDETCINLAVGDKIRFINKKYNYCHNREYNRPIEEKDAFILHYVGKDKDEMIIREKYAEIVPIKKYIAGQSVAIVGNAKSLFDRKYGKEINEHDFVIRFNKGFVIDPESQGTKTSFLILACPLTKEQIDSYGSTFVANRSASSKYGNEVQYTLGNRERNEIKNFIGSQPSTGFMAVDISLCFGAKSIDLYGFDFEETPTFYNPKDYKTQHDYTSERQILEEYERIGLIKIHR